MLTEIITGYRKSAALNAFVKSKAPIFIGKMGAMTLDEIACYTKTSAERFGRLLDVMIDCEILILSEGKYSLTKNAVALASEDSIETLWINCELGEHYWEIWPDYFGSLGSGATRSAFEKKHGKKFFDFITDVPSLKTTFDSLMAAITDEISDELIKIFDIHPNHRVVDIGGGKGILAKKLKQTFSFKDCTVIDRYAKELEFSDGITYLNCDFFNQIKSGANVYILKNILHDWDDDKAGKILANCAHAMSKNSILYIVEIIKEHGSVKGKTLDLLMDALFVGKERYYDEYERLAFKNDLVIDSVIQTSHSQSVLLLRKAHG
ncbi:hypothetical protein BB987_01800 [Photorhabdus temperata]|uniref:Methylase involved in ubiquinone/menaquinone biosynthesis n=1 Tax=Photorhabdus khanii NC19 TaxID=1004151 RepID=W3V3X2_9GAMM|nr:methyltransferase [Photorhabdus khanii]ETS30621.1 methylase involved in ubiquinone/menaquinone biosynthesis [Photorhabdus khanii NC19]OHV54097.1 hypothetical protein BB987_01800 [Photorhabdus temperata]